LITPLGSWQQVEHLLAHRVNPILRDDVPRERLPGQRIDDGLDRPVRQPRLRKVAAAFGVCRQVRPQHRSRAHVVDELL
jgi:hypothetical protein